MPWSEDIYKKLTVTIYNSKVGEHRKKAAVILYSLYIRTHLNRFTDSEDNLGIVLQFSLKNCHLKASSKFAENSSPPPPAKVWLRLWHLDDDFGDKNKAIMRVPSHAITHVTITFLWLHVHHSSRDSWLLII